MIRKETIEAILKFVDERNWQQFHTGEHLAKALTIEASELLELYQWKHEVDCIEDLKDELADVLTYAILISEEYHFDLDEIINDKLKKNNDKYPVEKAYASAKKYTEL